MKTLHRFQLALGGAERCAPMHRRLTARVLDTTSAAFAADKKIQPRLCPDVCVLHNNYHRRSKAVFDASTSRTFDENSSGAPPLLTEPQPRQDQPSTDSIAAEYLCLETTR